MSAEPATAALGELWPLFGLRLRTERLELRLPRDAELPPLLAAARAGVHDPAEMPFSVPWTALPPPAFERGFLRHWWRTRASVQPDDWCLGFAVFRDGRPIGAQDLAARDFPVLRVVSSGSWLTRAEQGQGLGKEMRAAVLHLAFAGLGARVARSSALDGNPASAAVSEGVGYERDGQDELVVAGRARRAQRFRLTRERWEATRRHAVDVEGLEGCLDMLGLDAC